MQANKAVSLREVAFRRALWRFGVRGYRVRSRLPGRPDIVFPRLKLAVFVHGCFWHACPECVLPAPRANAEFWHEKFIANRRRDEKAVVSLRTQGWTPVTVWEHEIRPDPFPKARQFAAELAARRRQPDRRA